MNEIYNKIAIIGGPGCGKTKLANNISLVTNIPICHLDGLWFKENWAERDKEEFYKMLIEKINSDKWIIEGSYSKYFLKERLEKADLIIILKFSKIRILLGILQRNKMNKRKR